MWAAGDEFNKNGDRVRLFLPILYSPARNADHTQKDPMFSHIGGMASYFPQDKQVDTKHPLCVACGERLCLLVKVCSESTDVIRALYVFGCNKAKCCSALFHEAGKKFSKGGNGVFICRRSQRHRDEQPFVAQIAVPTKEPSPWGSESLDGADNDWAVDDPDKGRLDDVEAMVAVMEVHSGKGSGDRQKLKPSRGRTNKSPSSAMLPCYEIHSQQEPIEQRIEGIEEDDVGMGNSSDDKIQQMLARYMAEEEDEEILSVLRGSANGGVPGGGGGGQRERDERLSAEDRAMLTFTDRVKREPRQVLRHAPGAVPLWSIPLPKVPVKTRDRADRGKKKPQQQKPLEMRVPACPCGASRVFEFQLMPSLLHVLAVDKHAVSSRKTTNTTSSEDVMKRAFDEGGMNWGAIAVYTCPETCEQSRDEFLIVQDSVDGRPERKIGATEDAMVVDSDSKTGMDIGEQMEDEAIDDIEEYISDDDEDS